jgi:GTP-binding protein
VDCQSPDPVTDLELINNELKSFDPELMEKPQIVVVTKADLKKDPEELTPLKERIETNGYEACIVSSVSGHGIEPLVKMSAERLEQIAPAQEKEEGWEP